MGLFSPPGKKLLKPPGKPNLKNPTNPLGLGGKAKRNMAPPPKGTPGQGGRLQNREEMGDQSQAMSRLGRGPGGRNFRKTAVVRPTAPTPPMSNGGNTPAQRLGNSGVVGPRRPVMPLNPAAGGGNAPIPNRRRMPPI